MPVGHVVPCPVGTLVFIEFAEGRIVVGLCLLTLLVALGDAAQRFGRAQDGVIGGGVANDFALDPVLLVIKLQGGSSDAVNAS